MAVVDGGGDNAGGSGPAPGRFVVVLPSVDGNQRRQVRSSA